MNDMPEKIWACIDQSTHQGWWEVEKTHDTDTRYVRADIVTALVEALVDWQLHEQRISAALAAYDATLQAE